MSVSPPRPRPMQSAVKRRRLLSPRPLLDETCLRDAFLHNGIPERHVATVIQHAVQKVHYDSEFDVGEIPNVPKALGGLMEDFARTTSTIVDRTDSRDGSTTKLLLELQDGFRVETVIMRYGVVELDQFPKSLLEKDDAGNTKFKCSGRATVCVSSQVGCRMQCTFCATGTMGLSANLTSGEILEQFYHAKNVEPSVRNVVFMGMGEPLDNYDEVVHAVRSLMDVRRFGLSPQRISISTVGIPRRIHQLGTDLPAVSLNLSLHAASQELRERLVPSAKAWDVTDILAAACGFVEQQRQSGRSKQLLVCEYVIIANQNDSAGDAELVGRLLKPHAHFIHLNVIPYNPTAIEFDYAPPCQETLDSFVAHVRESGVKVTLRQKMGQDISSACGQLVVQSQSRLAKRSAKTATTPGGCCKGQHVTGVKCCHEVNDSWRLDSAIFWGVASAVGAVSVALAVLVLGRGKTLRNNL